MKDKDQRMSNTKQQQLKFTKHDFTQLVKNNVMVFS
jgi:hypothetical protein